MELNKPEFGNCPGFEMNLSIETYKIRAVNSQ